MTEENLCENNASVEVIKKISSKTWNRSLYVLLVCVIIFLFSINIWMWCERDNISQALILYAKNINCGK